MNQTVFRGKKFSPILPLIKIIMFINPQIHPKNLRLNIIANKTQVTPIYLIKNANAILYILTC